MAPSLRIDEIEVYRAEPSGTPRGAVIVIHEIWGLVDQIVGVADRWSGEGYLAVAPDIMSHVGVSPDVGLELQRALASPDEAIRTAAQPRLRDALVPIRQPGYAEWAIARLRAVVDWLDATPGVDGRIAVTGFCFGGTYSFALAAADDRVKVAVPFYGHAPDAERIRSIACPVLALYGELDPPLIDALPELRERMAAAGVDFTDVVYPGARHAFFNETNSTTWDPEAAADAWRRATGFVARQLD